MATVVLDLDLEDLPSSLGGFDRYTAALILLRFRRRPLGQIHMPVQAGQILIPELLERARLTVGESIAMRFLHDALDWDAPETSAETLPTATVAVCTRDRPADLERCLEYLKRLEDVGQEIVVVDNCPSTSASRDVVARIPGVRYILEEQKGLDRARNRAVREAHGDIVAFCDDDAAPDPAWLRELLRNFADPLVMCVTGLTMPLELETEAQEWFERYTPLGRGFHRVVFDSTIGLGRAGRVGAGANMAIRRSLIDELGPFDEALDAGTPTHSGGDTEYFLRILAAGYSIVYAPSALSWHRHRRTWPELQRALFGYGAGVYAAWTRHVVLQGEVELLKAAAGWFRYVQLPALVRSSLGVPGSTPLELLLAELRGCAAGPAAYLLNRSTDRHGRRT